MMRVNVYENNRKHSTDDWRWHGILFSDDNSTLATCKANDRDTCEAGIEAMRAWKEETPGERKGR